MYGKNSNISSELYEMRKKFKTFSDFQNIEYFLDQHHLIGKIDNQRNVLYPNRLKLSQIRNESSQINFQAFDFVIANFRKAIAQFGKLIEQNKISQSRRSEVLNNPLTKLEPLGGYRDPFIEYSDYLSISRNFIYEEIIKNPAMKKKILKFSDYCDLFFTKILNEVPDIPIYFSSYVVSNFNSPLTTGLCLEIYDNFYDDDSFKVLNFFSQTNYFYYKQIIENNGFKIDNNVPWRIIADINSKQMQESLKAVNKNLEQQETISPEVFTSIYYTKVNNDFEIIVSALLQDYNRFASTFPTVSVFKENKCFNPTNFTKLTRNLYKRSDLSTKDLSKLFYYYIETKTKIMKANYTASDRNLIYRESLQLIRQDVNKAINFIDFKFRHLDHLAGVNTSIPIKTPADISELDKFSKFSNLFK